jgi:hypothetical protein
MGRLVTWGPAAYIWLAALYGALQLQRLPVGSFGGHDVCGPWGCGPPTAVLLACHVFWVALICPPAVFAASRLPAKFVWHLGIGLVAVGLFGLVGVAVWEATTWLPQASAWQRHYIGQRYLFALVTLVEAPIAQSLLIGAGLCLSSCTRTAASLERDSDLVDPSQSIARPTAEQP